MRQHRWLQCVPLLLLALCGRGLAVPAEMTVQGTTQATAAGDRGVMSLDEPERLRRIALDFNLTREQVFERVRSQIPDLTEQEFARWDDAGLFEHMDIDGERRYFGRTASNLFRISAEARARRADPKPFV